MTDRPILFSGPMVRALLDGRKTQTRRVLKPQPAQVDEVGRWYRMPSGGHSLNCYNLTHAPGDRLWARETWRARLYSQDVRPRDMDPCTRIHFEADGEPGPIDDGTNWDRQRPSIFMPRWASRLTLIITEVRVERLQDISETDAKAEGPHQHEKWPREFHGSWREAFQELWDSINAKRGFGWHDNPWVVALTFTVHQANIDALEQDRA